MLLNNLLAKEEIKREIEKFRHCMSLGFWRNRWCWLRSLWRFVAVCHWKPCEHNPCVPRSEEEF